jgi:hypothetical protein
MLKALFSVNVETPHGNIKIHNAHIPNGQVRLEENRDFRGYSRHYSEEYNLRILCGDFNSLKPNCQMEKQ